MRAGHQEDIGRLSEKKSQLILKVRAWFSSEMVGCLDHRRIPAIQKEISYIK